MSLRRTGFLSVNEFEAGRILDGVVAVAHGAAYSADRVANHAADTGLCRGGEDSIFDRRIEIAGKEERRIVTACAPF